MKSAYNRIINVTVEKERLSQKNSSTAAMVPSINGHNFETGKSEYWNSTS